MLYLIDANNLAGCLGLLAEEDFDQKLIVRIRDYFSGKGILAILVFDPRDDWGDDRMDGNLEVVYAPRSRFSAGADDKILEIINRRLSDVSFNGEVVAVSDDIDLNEKIKTVVADRGARPRVRLEKASVFAEKLLFSEEKKSGDQEDGRARLAEGAEDLNRELLKIWKKN